MEIHKRLTVRASNFVQSQPFYRTEIYDPQSTSAFREAEPHHAIHMFVWISGYELVTDVLST